MKRKEPKVRTDEDYRKLDDAIGTMSEWQREIQDELAKKGISWKAFSETLSAMVRVHSPEE